MHLFHVAFVVLVAGVVLWLINAHVPMQAQAKNLLNIVVVGGLALWIVLLLMRAFGSGPLIG